MLEIEATLVEITSKYVSLKRYKKNVRYIMYAK